MISESYNCILPIEILLLIFNYVSGYLSLKISKKIRQYFLYKFDFLFINKKTFVNIKNSLSHNIYKKNLFDLINEDIFFNIDLYKLRYCRYNLKRTIVYDDVDLTITKKRYNNNNNVCLLVKVYKSLSMYEDLKYKVYLLFRDNFLNINSLDYIYDFRTNFLFKVDVLFNRLNNKDKYKKLTFDLNNIRID